MQTILLFLKGFVMGMVELIPGVSAGTIAFITGIYTELLDSIKGLNLSALKVWKERGFRAFWTAINGRFLLTLVTGMFLALLSFSRLIQYVLKHHPELCWSFFFGLIIAASLYIARDIKWNFARILLFASGIGVMAYIFTASSGALEPTPINLIIGGAVAISAMLLPGISGSFMLVLMGLYAPVLAALNSFDLPVLLYFIFGIGAGLLLFTRLLSWLLHHYAQAMQALLTGVMIGSLIKIWPWKETAVRFNARSLIETFERNVLPSWSTEIIPALLLMVLGVTVVFAVELAAKRLLK